MKVHILRLETFVQENGLDSITSDIIFDAWTAQVYIEMLGEALGARVQKVAQQQQARNALESTMTKTTPSEMDNIRKCIDVRSNIQ